MKMLETMNNASEISKAEAEVSEMNSCVHAGFFYFVGFFYKEVDSVKWCVSNK